MTAQDDIAKLHAHKQLTTNAAIHLILENQERIERDIASIASIKKTQQQFPSLTYLLKHNRRDTIAVITILLATYHFMLEPVTISNIRRLIAAVTGIPIP